MLGWAQVKRHVAEEITLLCDQHHREKTSGLLPAEKVNKANANPYNYQSGVSKPYDLHYSGEGCEAIVGSNKFSTSFKGEGTMMVAVSVDSIPLLGFVVLDGHLLLNLNVFDQHNEPVLHIVNNYLLYSPTPWDISFVGRNLIIREAQRQFLLDITFEVPNRILINRGHFLCNGVEIIIKPEYIFLSNDKRILADCMADDCTVGLAVGPHPQNLGIGFHWPKIKRYFRGKSEVNKEEKEAWEEIQQFMR